MAVTVTLVDALPYDLAVFITDCAKSEGLEPDALIVEMLRGCKALWGYSNRERDVPDAMPWRAPALKRGNDAWNPYIWSLVVSIQGPFRVGDLVARAAADGRVLSKGTAKSALEWYCWKDRVRRLPAGVYVATAHQAR